MNNYNAINIKLEIYNDDALHLQQDLHWYIFIYPFNNIKKVITYTVDYCNFKQLG